MKFYLIFLILPVALLAQGAPATPAWHELDALIASTEGLVAKQKSLKETLEKYQSLHDEYIEDMDNKALLLKCAKQAHIALELIKNERLSMLFDSSFISEMTLFAKLAAKPALPKLDK